MTALEAYALAKKIAISAVSGIKNLSVDGTTLIIETNDGNILNMDFPVPKDGNGITKTEINSYDHLIITYDDGTVEDAGLIHNADVEVTQLLKEGIKIAKIKINGVTTDLFAPRGGGGGGDCDYYIIDLINSLPDDLTENDRRIYFCLEDNNFHLWNGIEWEIISCGGNVESITLTQAEYDALTPEEKADTSKIYYVTDAETTAIPLSDNEVSAHKVWSSQKISDELDTKVDKVVDKGLSTNDYTNEEKTKLAGLVNYSLPNASDTTLGGIKVGTNLSIDANGVLSASGSTPYELPKASANTLGGVKVGNNLSIDQNGVLSSSATPYNLPTASSSTLGGVKVGNGLSIDNNGVLSASGSSITIKHAYIRFTYDSSTTVSSKSSKEITVYGGTGSEQTEIKNAITDNRFIIAYITSGCYSNCDVILTSMNMVYIRNDALCADVRIYNPSDTSLTVNSSRGFEIYICWIAK